MRRDVAQALYATLLAAGLPLTPKSLSVLLEGRLSGRLPLTKPPTEAATEPSTRKADGAAHRHQQQPDQERRRRHRDIAVCSKWLLLDESMHGFRWAAGSDAPRDDGQQKDDAVRGASVHHPTSPRAAPPIAPLAALLLPSSINATMPNHPPAAVDLTRPAPLVASGCRWPWSLGPSGQRSQSSKLWTHGDLLGFLYELDGSPVTDEEAPASEEGRSPDLAMGWAIVCRLHDTIRRCSHAQQTYLQRFAVALNARRRHDGGDPAECVRTSPSTAVATTVGDRHHTLPCAADNATSATTGRALTTRPAARPVFRSQYDVATAANQWRVPMPSTVAASSRWQLALADWVDAHREVRFQLQHQTASAGSTATTVSATSAAASSVAFDKALFEACAAGRWTVALAMLPLSRPSPRRQRQTGDDVSQHPPHRDHHQHHLAGEASPLFQQPTLAQVNADPGTDLRPASAVARHVVSVSSLRAVLRGLLRGPVAKPTDWSVALRVAANAWTAAGLEQRGANAERGDDDDDDDVCRDVAVLLMLLCRRCDQLPRSRDVIERMAAPMAATDATEEKNMTVMRLPPSAVAAAYAVFVDHARSQGRSDVMLFSNGMAGIGHGDRAASPLKSGETEGQVDKAAGDSVFLPAPPPGGFFFQKNFTLALLTARSSSKQQGRRYPNRSEPEDLQGGTKDADAAYKFIANVLRACVSNEVAEIADVDPRRLKGAVWQTAQRSLSLWLSHQAGLPEPNRRPPQTEATVRLAVLAQLAGCKFRHWHTGLACLAAVWNDVSQRDEGGDVATSRGPLSRASPLPHPRRLVSEEDQRILLERGVYSCSLGGKWVEAMLIVDVMANSLRMPVSERTLTQLRRAKTRYDAHGAFLKRRHQAAIVAVADK